MPRSQVPDFSIHCDIETIAGSGFTACLADETNVICYQGYLYCFIQYYRGYFRNIAGQFFSYSKDQKTSANMMILAIDSF